ncbi:hypothetical protein [Escherichia phage vB_EcoS_swi2]|uniref:Uncharacterized protein n=1 Tax=Escherichia phage vB_EcoS_swi2 TaxID=2769808 RepID=A0A862QMA2_9CAUD|nr:hypothetical protein KGB49_gp64 [Escherichia phage vB_EcoS_swi2]QNR52460.1 hypothetical protein [Escherichia phage vB_EcoS_swi2]
MRWAINHKSGRTLFVTSDKFIANNRRKMGWIVEEMKMTSRKQFEGWAKENGMSLVYGDCDYVYSPTAWAWKAWQASRAEVEIESPDFIDSRSALNKGYTVDYSNGFGDAMDAYEMVIEQAGLEVKK